MVTGAYPPETSGAALQCRQLIASLRRDAEFAVLTTTTDPRLAAHDRVDDTDVWRVYLDPTSASSKAAASVRMGAAFLQWRERFDLVHLHGFSQKSMLLIALARIFGKRILIKLTSVGHDDAVSMRQEGAIAFRFYASADRFIGVSPHFERLHNLAGVAPSGFRLVPNGVDLVRFRDAPPPERRAARLSLGLPIDDPVVLFVGFFSHEKRPDLLYRAWATLAERGIRSTLVLVGASRSTYYEIDAAMIDGIRRDVEARGLQSQVVFVERTTEIERYYRAADIFALPTLREGLPNALLEAMASGIPSVITRLEGVTDWIVEDGVNGLLMPPNDERALEEALARLIGSRELRARLGRAARSRAEHFSAERTAERTLSVYHELISG